jgi:hypothetical protein
MKPEDNQSSFVPSEDWTEAFDAQCTESMRKRAKRIAARSAHSIGKGGHSNYANDLVQDVLSDTVLGVLHWDPDAKSFELHIRDAIWMRARRDRAHARRFPHESIDALTPDGDSATMAEADAALLANAPCATAETVALAAEAMVELRKLASGDRPVLRLLDAFASGATSKADVMRVAKLSSAAYHNAHRRLARLVTQLPIHIRPSWYILAKGV